MFDSTPVIKVSMLKQLKPQDRSIHKIDGTYIDLQLVRKKKQMKDVIRQTKS